ncbi:MAG: alpha-glucan family phosphorylase [Parachlamydiaceae bacterium]|nr:alpha-glucan family phosphorylase [Parachlamydiaceae bacterium]
MSLWSSKNSVKNDFDDIEGYHLLKELALDFSWSWVNRHHADLVWQQLDPELWKLTRNPWGALQTISRKRLAALLAQPDFMQLLQEAIEAKRAYAKAPGWFQKKHSKDPLTIAYFSMEFMLGEALPIYSGGLGNVAGDQLKAASDLDVPIIGIGLLYQQGYFRQVIDNNGAQKAYYPFNSPEQLPIVPLRTADGEWLRIEIPVPGWSIWLRTWEVVIGKVKLYLLDSNDPANFPPHRGITSELYGGDSELRLKQELVLGIGGWRLLTALGIKPDVCHLNEGHAAFAVLERAHCFMKENNVTFEVALAATRAGNLFTTHTAVPAGFDRFTPQLIEQYLSIYAKNRLGIPLQQLLALGRERPDDPNEPFNMAYLALRGSGAANGVSRLHGEVSRRLFSPLFPRWPESEVPIGYVTNGIHTPSWGSSEAIKFWETHCGNQCWAGIPIEEQKSIRHLPDMAIWKMRNNSSKVLIEYARERLARMLEARGEDPEWVSLAKHIFDPNVLTIGFARRFATYKRPNLLLHDPDRLLRILTNPKAPVQLVLSGKAHPADKVGQALIQQWMRFIKRPEVRPHVIFFEDYDMLVTKQLVRGVDLWINTPRRPWEACGTSGMKTLVNGGLNLSVLDGWWAEAYAPELGWAIGDGKEHGDDPLLDIAEAEKLYELLETQVIPEFYNRSEEGIPKAWVSKMRESMARLTPIYSADRAVQEYTEKFYLPAAEAYRERAKEQAALTKKLSGIYGSIAERWSGLRFGDIRSNVNNGARTYDLQVYLNGLKPEEVKVELYADARNGTGPEKREMACTAGLTTGQSLYLYRATIPAERPIEDYTPRIVPNIPKAKVPLEESNIAWQH